MRFAAAILVLGMAAGCSSDPPREPAGASPGESVPTPTTTPSTSVTPEPSGSPTPPRRFDPDRAVAAVDHLAGRIGPRHATSRAFRRAADWVAAELLEAGYDVRRQAFDVPGGSSWGVPVEAGRSQNVIATEPGFDPTKPYLVVGAHLDTVPQAPGAEDNASGVGVLLALARTDLAARLPVVLVAFGAEEPRGPTDDDHHYGSRHFVASLAAAERRAVQGMVSLDRVGVGQVVPVGAATGEPTPLVRAARRAGVRVVAQSGQRSSDHWSFVRAGLPGLRIGSTPYAEYHSAADLPPVVSRAQLARVGRLVVAWLS